MTTQDRTDDEWQAKEERADGFCCPTCGEEIEGLADKVADRERISPEDRRCLPCVRKVNENRYDAIHDFMGEAAAERFMDTLEPEERP